MANITPTPKVAAAAVAGIIAAALLANVDLITPDLFEGLGKWSHLVYGLTIALVMSAAGWLKSEGGKASGDTPSVPQPDAAPAAVFPKAAVDAALAALPVQEYVPLDKPAVTDPATIA